MGTWKENGLKAKDERRGNVAPELEREPPRKSKRKKMEKPWVVDMGSGLLGRWTHRFAKEDDARRYKARMERDGFTCTLRNEDE